jgi:hypothetical protein
MKSPVLAYYRLTNFYQNHRRYVKSFDQEQLSGTARSFSQIDRSDCDPLRTDNATKKAYYPCGLIANSMFNDTFVNLKLLNAPDSDNGVPYDMSTSGIAWPSDKKLYGKSQYNPSDVVPPPNWVRRWPSYTDTLPDLENDESFQVWMRTSALPTFSKLAMRNDNTAMTAGVYEIEIWDGKTTTIILGSLMNCRVQRHALQWHQGVVDHQSNSHGWPEQLFGYCLHCCWWYLPPSRSIVHRWCFDQAKVCILSLLKLR